MSEYAKYMDEAWRLHDTAERQLNWWRLTDKKADLRVAAMMGWEAVSLGARVLYESRGAHPPPERRALLHAFHYLEKDHPDIRERRIRMRLTAIGSTLYTDCFYDGECYPDEVVRCVREEAREFMEDVAELAKAAKPEPSGKEAIHAPRVHG